MTDEEYIMGDKRFNSVVNRLIEMASNGEDGTVSYNGYGLPESGYYVGGAVPGVKVNSPDELDIYDVVKFVNLSPWVEFYGVWTDQETGTVYIDAVDHYSDLDDALFYGTERGEVAIWDISNSAEINLNSLTSI